MNWYVRVPRWDGDAVHPRYWSVVSAEAGSEQDEICRTELVRNGSGEMVPTTSWYVPVESEAAGREYITAALRRWKE